jgi:ATP-dependent Zn protease
VTALWRSRCPTTVSTAILTIHGHKKQLGPDVDLDAVSRGTPGFSGAILSNLVNEAAINAVRDRRDILSAADFSVARDRLLIVLGMRQMPCCPTKNIR